MTDVLYPFIFGLVALLVLVSFCVFAVSQRDRWPLACALVLVGILGLQYCSMRNLP